MGAAPAKALDRTTRRAGKMGWSRTLGRLADGRNINPETLLATDYLNHFNEVVMLIEMAADMPDCIEDVAAWEPLSYEEHFRRSAFAAKELAILAYENSPPRFRDPFDAIVDQADTVALKAAKELSELIGDGENMDTERVSFHANEYAGTLRRLVDMASGIINGKGLRTHQEDIDAILAEDDDTGPVDGITDCSDTVGGASPSAAPASAGETGDGSNDEDGESASQDEIDALFG